MKHCQCSVPEIDAQGVCRSCHFKAKGSDRRDNTELAERLAESLAAGEYQHHGETVDAPAAVIRAEAEILARYDAWLAESLTETMDIETEKYTIKMSRDEMKALLKGLDELKLLCAKYPAERNGYDMNSQSTVERIHRELAETWA